MNAQNEAMSAKNARMENENESLRAELQNLQMDYSSLQADMSEAKEYYLQVDLVASKMGHRCEVRTDWVLLWVTLPSMSCGGHSAHWEYMFVAIGRFVRKLRGPRNKYQRYNTIEGEHKQ